MKKFTTVYLTDIFFIEIGSDQQSRGADLGNFRGPRLEVSAHYNLTKFAS